MTAKRTERLWYSLPHPPLLPPRFLALALEGARDTSAMFELVNKNATPDASQLIVVLSSKLMICT